MMTNLIIEYKEMECYNEIKYIKIDNVIYQPKYLSNELKELLTMMTYIDYNDSECFDNISQILGQEKVSQGISELKNMNVQMIN